jgi:hypothetical protein
MAYDPECEELARHFMQGHPQHRDSVLPYIGHNIEGLSQAIQDAVEDWFLDHDSVWGRSKRAVKAHLGSLLTSSLSGLRHEK